MRNKIDNKTFTDENKILHIECRTCGLYKTENQFYRNNKRSLGRDADCKVCRTQKEITSPTNHNARIDNNNLFDWEVDMTIDILTRLGYEVGNPDNPVYKQFNKRHGF